MRLLVRISDRRGAALRLLVIMKKHEVVTLTVHARVSDNELVEDRVTPYLFGSSENVMRSDSWASVVRLARRVAVSCVLSSSDDNYAAVYVVVTLHSSADVPFCSWRVEQLRRDLLRRELSAADKSFRPSAGRRTVNAKEYLSAGSLFSCAGSCSG